MMKMTEKLLGKQSMIHLIFLSHLGIRFPKKERISAKVKFINSYFNLELLEKNRHKRPSLEDVLNHPWFADFKDIKAMRINADGGDSSKF
jgi:hypothetical protein